MLYNFIQIVKFYCVKMENTVVE